MPALSCGIFGFPVNFAAAVILRTLLNFLNQSSLLSLRIVIIDDPTFKQFKEVFLEVAASPASTAHLDALLAKYRSQYATQSVQSNRAPVQSHESAWSWRDDDYKFYGFDSGLDQQIEEAFQRGQSSFLFRVDSGKYKGGMNYTIDFGTMTQRNDTSGYERKLQHDVNAALRNTEAKRIQEEEERRRKQATPQLLNSGTSAIAMAQFTIFGYPADLQAVEGELNKRLGNSPPPPLFSLLSTQNFHSTERLWKTDTIVFDLSLISPPQRLSLEKEAGYLDTEVQWNTQKGQVDLQGLESALPNAKIKLLEELMQIKQSSGEVSFPKEWAPQTQPLQLFDIPNGSPEWQTVAGRFGQTMNASNIRKIERVQNRFLWRSYVLHRETVLLKNNNGSVNERLLFHGTRNTAPENIYDCDEGFDMRYSNPGMWGRGNYFAVNARYSNDYKSTAGNGLFQFFLASVITGDSHNCPANGSIQMPPPKQTNLGLKTVRYDSVSGNTNGSDIFILYDNKGSYPSYLITFQG